MIHTVDCSQQRSVRRRHYERIILDAELTAGLSTGQELTNEQC